MSTHSITQDSTLSDGTEVFRCRNCGLVQKTREAFDVYACSPVSEEREPAANTDHTTTTP